MRFRKIFLMAMIFSAPVLAKVQTEVVEYNHVDVRLKGFLAFDAAIQGPRPAVLVVHEWWGLNDYARRRAGQLAELGYVAFALDMYGIGMVAQNAQEAGQLAGQFYQNRALMRERVQAGLQVLLNHPLTNRSQVAAIGYCFGGTCVLELARSGADIAGVVSFHGGLNTPRPEEAQNIKARVLVLHGADDPYVKTEDVLEFQQEMRAAEVDWQMVSYGGAVHAFSNPAAGSDTATGAAYNEKADRRSWRAMKTFFIEIFAPDQPAKNN